MTRYTAVFTGASSDTATTYTFEAPDDYYDCAPHQALVMAMENIEKTNFAEHHDYEIHAVSRNRERNVVMGIGYLVSGKGEIPFTIRVTPA